MTRASGTLLRTAASTSLMTSASSRVDKLTVELELGGDEQILRPEVLGADVDHAAHIVPALHRLHDATLDIGRRRLAQQQAAHLDGEDGGDDDQQSTDGEAADRVVRGVAGDLSGDHGYERDAQTDERREVLE